MVQTESVSMIDSTSLPEGEIYQAFDTLPDIPEAVVGFAQHY
jgi:hypothetical protein